MALLRLLAHNSRRCNSSVRFGCSSISSSSSSSISSDADDDDDDRRHRHRVVDVSPLAHAMRVAVRDYSRRETNIKLLGILAHHGPADAQLYSDRIQMTCQEDGLDYEVCRVAGDQPRDVEDAIRHANAREDVHGMLVYYPMFQHRRRGPYKNRLTGVYYKTHDDYLRDLVLPSKDVEGLGHEHNPRWLFRPQAKQGKEPQPGTTIYPCTALSVLRILDSQDVTWEETTIITIINRSEILGRPLAVMLANLGATVYSIDENSTLLFRSGGRLRRCTGMCLDRCISQSSVIISAVPSPDFALPISSIQPGTTVVNVSEYCNVNEEALLETIPGVQFIPQVGKVTVAVLEQNLISLHQRQQREANSR
jgi:methylenetetrahydrofolate dehydrogenase (NAD+)